MLLHDQDAGDIENGMIDQCHDDGIVAIVLDHLPGKKTECCQISESRDERRKRGPGQQPSSFQKEYQGQEKIRYRRVIDRDLVVYAFDDKEITIFGNLIYQ